MGKWIALTLIVLLVITLIGIVGVTAWVQAEAPFRKDRLADAGRTKALILYHPSRDAHFSDDVTMALARGFEEAGLAVERWTMTRETPAHPQGFAVIAIVSNTFFWAPDWPTQRYLERADLHGQNVLAILGGGGNTQRAQVAFVGDIGKSGARLLAIRALWTSRPNEADAKPAGNRQLAMQIAHRMARDAGKQALASLAGSSVNVGHAPSGDPANAPQSTQDRADLGRERIP
jgi:hypothetical protein